MNVDSDFFITAMPDTRPADYYFGYLEGSVFMDFENYEGDYIRLIRMSFDGYGCCDMGDQAIPMDKQDSRTFKDTVKAGIPDQSQLTVIVKKTILDNRKLLWEDALKEYGLC